MLLWVRAREPVKVQGAFACEQEHSDQWENEESAVRAMEIVWKKIPSGL